MKAIGDDKYMAWWNAYGSYRDPEDEYIVWVAAILAERERCAQIAEECNWRKSGDNTNTDIANAIRGGK